METTRPQNTPQLPEGSLVSIDQHLEHSTIQAIVSDRYVDLASLSPQQLFKDEHKMKMVINSKGRQSYKMVRKTKEIDNIFKYLNNMFIFGACYLRHRPEQGPEFLQYLFNVLASNKDYIWSAVLDYDCDFKTHRA